jgi:hypothetical protein
MMSGSEDSRIERLVSLCKLWGAVKYFHPYLAYNTFCHPPVAVET